MSCSARGPSRPEPVATASEPRRLEQTLLTVLAGFWLIVLLGLPLYVFPPVDEVGKSDAVFVLGPPMDARLELAERLRDEGLADRIVISVQAVRRPDRAGHRALREEDVTCEVADPFDHARRGAPDERAASGAEAPSVIVVTTAPHVARTRYMFGKCYPGEVTVVSAEQPATLSAWASQYVYQSVAFVKALLEPCP